jgi:hypothetical protein
MYSKFVSMGIFCLIVGCSVALLSIPTNGTSQSSEKSAKKSKPLPPYISRLFRDKPCQTNEGRCFKFERENGEENQCEHNWVDDEYGEQVVEVSCEKKFSVTNPTYLKITGFDKIRLPLITDNEAKEQKLPFEDPDEGYEYNYLKETLQFFLYTKSGIHLLKISFPIKAFTANRLCIYTSPQGDVCTKNVTLKDIVMSVSKKEPIKMDFSSLEKELCSSFSSETSSARGDYKLIVVSLSKDFENKFKTTIQKSLQELLFDLKDNHTNKQFTLLVIGSGRGLKEVLTSEKLSELPKEGKKHSILSKVRGSLQFAAQDLRPMDDLELVDDLIEDYKLQDKQIGHILYITNDDRFGDEMPRNQCMPLAWHRDNIQLEVLTSQSCEIWRKHARLVQPKQCKEIQNKDLDGLVKVFKEFLAN